MIHKNLQAIQNQVDQAAQGCGRDPKSVMLIGVSKRKRVEKLIEAIEAGCENLGENYIQEAMEKIDIIGKARASWHFIGHLQSKKSKFAVKYFDYIHTVDTFKLAREINKQAEKIGKVQKILVQVNIAEESTKSGAGADEVVDLVRQISDFENLSVRGLMCMPPYFADPEEARGYFQHLAQIQQQIIAEDMDRIVMEHLSMGMSNDFSVAIQEGATMVRVGTAIFGSRD